MRPSLRRRMLSTFRSTYTARLIPQTHISNPVRPHTQQRSQFPTRWPRHIPTPRGDLADSHARIRPPRRRVFKRPSRDRRTLPCAPLADLLPSQEYSNMATLLRGRPCNRGGGGKKRAHGLLWVTVVLRERGCDFRCIEAHCNELLKISGGALTRGYREWVAVEARPSVAHREWVA